ncbi:MAG: hypothetical protein IPM53_10915 [Anaerolineaceae bacterium]|nr:hypothetical protein [Anaerolineaceae bacterium]
MSRLLIGLSLIALLGGFLFLSEATTGVGIIAAAGVLGIWSRIYQAENQHKEVLAKLAENEKTAVE